MTKKIAFLETNPPNERGVFTKCNGFELYGLELLATITKREGFELDIWQQNGKPAEVFAEEIFAYSPDMIL